MPINVKLLRESFEAIKPVAGDVATHFYQELFERYPAAKALFKMDRLDQQKTALVQSLVTIFDNLEKPDVLQDYLKKMGGRHVKYGVQNNHYDWVAESLMATLEFFFDDTWTTELADAWMAALGLIAETMRAGASAQTQPKPEREDNMRDEIDHVLRGLMKNSLQEAALHADVRELAANQARALIRGALQEQLKELKEKFNPKKAA